MPSCRSCGAEVIWTVTKTGKKMPVDAKPDPDGKLIVWKNDAGVHARYEDDAPAFVQNRPSRFTSHFATCPQAQQHRRAGDS